ncbi:MAG TPA: HNH endonuclease [Candidatus Sulfotelmatobacter sp.]|nr:HNH endonuclease [Candidatus Sulfotelmatobacter sp.]
MDDRDPLIRMEAFGFLDRLRSQFGEILPRAELAKGFVFDGIRVPLLSAQGIFKPAALERVPLSITTVPIIEGQPRPYEDETRPDGLISYKYRSHGGPQHRDNVGLRLAMTEKTPLVYFHGVEPGYYEALYPVLIVGDDPRREFFIVAVSNPRLAGEALPALAVAESMAEIQREYVTAAVLRRVHQASFRFRVLRAYKHTCAICRLRHAELLDAAHILPDGHPKGEPWVSNGISLCKLHHAAYDKNVLGIRPHDLIVEVRSDIRKEDDGPTLRHALQELHGTPLGHLPRSRAQRPKREFLEERYEQFRSTAH